MTGHIITAGMRREQHRAITRERLLQVGADLFSRSGYSATGIQEIVTAAGVPKGSFYNYFPGKRQYAAEIIRFYGERLLRQWAEQLAADADAPAWNRLQQAFENMARQCGASPVGTGCLIGSLVSELAEAGHPCREALEEATTAWCAQMGAHLRQAQEQGAVRDDLPAEQLAELLWSVWEGSLLRMKLTASSDAVTRMMSLFFTVLAR